MPIIVFCDGSSRGNPGPGGWGAIIATDDSVVELGAADANTTNNRMEMSAALAALEHIGTTTEPVLIRTDSSYLINGITKWIHGWRRKGWKTSTGGDVLNKDLWERLARVNGKHVQWQHVAGHAGIPGNERADTIATEMADGVGPHLYRGERAGYDIELDVVVSASPKKSKSKSRAAKGKAHSYLSLVSGEAMRHGTWGECEARVRGVAGARYKKALSAADEEEILRGWGVAPASLKS